MPRRLPDIQRELNKLIERTNTDLRDLPPPPSSEPLREILRLITDFSRAVEKQVGGVPGREGLLQRIRPQQEVFRTAIRTTAPCFVPKYREAAEAREVPEETASQSLSNEDWEPYQRLLFLEGEENYEEIGLDDGKEIFIDDVLETAKWYATLNISLGFQLLTAIFQSRAVTRELPNNYPFVVQRGYIIDTVSQWDDPAKTLFDFAVEKVKEMMLRVIDSHFERHAHGNLKQRVL